MEMLCDGSAVPRNDRASPQGTGAFDGVFRTGSALAASGRARPVIPINAASARLRPSGRRSGRDDGVTTAV